MAMMEFLEQAQRGDDYIRALEEERRKIEVFQRELPLCLQLITQAIESIRQQMSSSVEGHGVGLEEITLLRPSPTAAEEEAVVRPDGTPDWLRSVQLWDQEPGTVERPKKPVAVKLKNIGGAFQPFEREKYVAAMSSTAAGDGGCRGGDDSIAGGGDDGDGDCIIVDKDKEKKEGAGAGGQSQPHRKARRSWAPELHRRFLHALHQLGGSHVATPKQIKELMKVEGLTNDEIKSHLQKYRLHHRRPSPALPQGSNVVHSCPPAPQFVLIRGILVQPPPEYTAATVEAAAVAPSGDGRACAPPAAIYAPVMSPSLPQDLIFQQQQQQNTKRSRRSTKLGQRKGEGKRNGDGDEDDGDDDDATNVTTSPTTSAFSHTTSISA